MNENVDCCINSRVQACEPQVLRRRRHEYDKCRNIFCGEDGGEGGNGGGGSGRGDRTLAIAFILLLWVLCGQIDVNAADDFSADERENTSKNISSFLKVVGFQEGALSLPGEDQDQVWYMCKKMHGSVPRLPTQSTVDSPITSQANSEAREEIEQKDNKTQKTIVKLAKTRSGPRRDTTDMGIAMKERCLILPLGKESHLSAEFVSWTNCSEAVPTESPTDELLVLESARKRQISDSDGGQFQDSFVRKRAGSRLRQISARQTEEVEAAGAKEKPFSCFVCRSDRNVDCDSIDSPPTPQQKVHIKPCSFKAPPPQKPACRAIRQTVSGTDVQRLTLRECGREAAFADGGCYRNAWGTQLVCECFTSACNSARTLGRMAQDADLNLFMLVFLPGLALSIVQLQQIFRA